MMLGSPCCGCATLLCTFDGSMQIVNAPAGLQYSTTQCERLDLICRRCKKLAGVKLDYFDPITRYPWASDIRSGCTFRWRLLIEDPFGQEFFDLDIYLQLPAVINLSFPVNLIIYADSDRSVYRRAFSYIPGIGNDYVWSFGPADLTSGPGFETCGSLTWSFRASLNPLP